MVCSWFFVIGDWCLVFGKVKRMSVLSGMNDLRQTLLFRFLHSQEFPFFGFRNAGF